MNEFNEMMQQAVAMKSHEMQSKRREFEKQPIFIKAGLYYTNELEPLRNSDDRWQKTLEFREKGNNLARQEEYSRAAHEYEKALGMYLYILNRKPNWKNEGILDEDLTYKDDASNDEILQLRVKILLNLSICYLKEKQLSDAIAACDMVLKHEENAKAYYRRGKCRIENINAEESDYRLTISDFEQALSIEEDELIRRDLAKAKLELRKMNRFNERISRDVISDIKKEANTKSDVVHEDPISSSDESVDSDFSEEWQKYQFKTLCHDPIYANDPNKIVPVEVIELGKFIETRALTLLRCYESQGKQEQAEQHKQLMALLIKAKSQLEKTCTQDFEHPLKQSDQLDFDDPEVKEEFRKLAEVNVTDLRKWLKQQQWPLPKKKKSNLDETLKSKIETLNSNQQELKSDYVIWDYVVLF